VSADAVGERLQLAAALFNEQRYHESHEVLDELWDAASQRDSDFLKGLIQAAIALHHYAQGNAAGARKLYSGHRQYLGPYLPRHRGLDVAQFLGAMQGCLAGVLRARPGEEPAFDPARAPRLEFTAED